MSKIKLKYARTFIDVSPSSFGKKIAKVMDESKSSGMFFIIQQAYGEIDWSEAQQILDEVLKSTEQNKKP